jgi:mono/diheme cytochrome c family protein
MEIVFVLAPFVVIGIGVLFIAFAGGAGAAREMYLTRGGKVFTLVIVVLYLALGVAVPAAVIASRGEAEGGVGALRTEKPSSADENGKTLFIQNCKSCHTLAAVQAMGVTGPDLDDLGGLDKERVMNAIKRGGTGSGRMPPGILQGEDAEDVAGWVAQVAGQ